MAFCAIDILEIGDQSKPFLYPSTDGMCNIVKEKWDNRLGNPVVADSIVVERELPGVYNPIKELELLEKLNLYITDSRVIMQCEKYDKGGGWVGFSVGGAITAAAINVGSKMLAKSRSKGTVLLGHLRYEWLLGIGYMQRKQTGWRAIVNHDSMTLCYSDDEGILWSITLVFKAGTGTELMANDILRRACTYRLAMNDEKNPECIDFFKKYKSGATMPSSGDHKQHSGFITFPSIYDAPFGENQRLADEENHKMIADSKSKEKIEKESEFADNTVEKMPGTDQIRCLNCNTMQPNNRVVCFDCGLKFK